MFEKTNERWCEPDILRIAGEIAEELPERYPASAEALFDRALAVAQAQPAESWELRAATSKARLWRDQGKPADACGLLAAVYNWFTEGFDTLDLRRGESPRDELRPQEGRRRLLGQCRASLPDFACCCIFRSRLCRSSYLPAKHPLSHEKASCRPMAPDRLRTGARKSGRPPACSLASSSRLFPG